jgi:hypothetical protein
LHEQRTLCQQAARQHTTSRQADTDRQIASRQL